MSSILQQVGNSMLTQAVGIFGTAPVTSALYDTALGIFGGTAQGRNVTTPVGGNIGSISGAMAVPQNTSGLGIFNQVVNGAPIGNLVGQLAGNYVQQAVQFSPSTKTGIVPVSNSVLPVIKSLGLPVSTAAAPIQQNALTISGAVNAVQQKIDQAQGGSDPLVTLGIVAAVAKLLRLW